MQQLPQRQDTTREATKEFLDSVDRLREESAWLRAQNEELTRENRLLHERVVMRESEINTIRAAHDFISRHDGDLMNSLGNIKTLIIAAEAKARATAFAPPGSGAEPQITLTEKDEQDLAKIVATIRPGEPDA